MAVFPFLSRRCAFSPLLLSLGLGAAAAPAGGLRVPAGFEVTVFAGDELATNLHAMTVNARGEVVVAGPGFVKILRDEDGDGMADRAVLFSEFPRTGAHGLYFDGDDLIATGDTAILRLRDADADGIADGAPEVLRTRMDHGEHGTHAVQRGPDGAFYVIAGNSPQPGGFQISGPASPVREARQGALLRFAADFRTCEVVADGFRNPYDFDFTATGQILTYEADGERVHHLPGYGPTRIYDVAIGEHHGWMLNGSRRSWAKPLSYFDRVDSVVDIGRGSPTGVLVYRHRQFPARYRDGVFAACWSAGTIYFVPLAPRGTTFSGGLETFLAPIGNEGFAPVDLAVAPNGDLFVAIGGRRTQGGVFRIRYVGEKPSPFSATDDVQRVLAADQPLSSWSRARWVPLARKLGAGAFAAAAGDPARPELDRIRALEVLVDLFGGVDDAIAHRVAGSGTEATVARLAWAAAHSPHWEGRTALLEALTRREGDRVRRAAWEGLLALPPAREIQPAWELAFDSPDRRVRSAAITLARRNGCAPPTDISAPSPRHMLARLRAAPGTPDLRKSLTLFRTVVEPELKMEAVRLLQIGLGDLRLDGAAEEIDTGYTALALETVPDTLRREIAHTVLASFPAGERELDLELARLLGLLRTETAAALTAVSQFWTPESSPDDDLHFLLVAAQLPGPRPHDVTRRTADALARLQPKMETRRWLPDRQWPQRVSEVFARLCQHDASLAPTLVETAAFGRPDHSLFVPLLPPATRAIAARRLLARAENASAAEDAWTSGLVETLGQTLPSAEVLPHLRPRLDDIRVREAVALVLAAHGDPADRPRLIAVLETSALAGVVEKVAAALAKMPVPSRAATTSDVRVALKGLARHGGTPSAALALDHLLATWTGQEPRAPRAGVPALLPSWLAWFSSVHPAKATGVVEAGAVDAAAWLRRLAGVDWSSGSPTQGALVYQQRACAACHDGGRRLGPALTGIAGRFGRDDLLLNIVDPNRSISPTYRAQEVTLKDGTVHLGVPVYQSSAAVILEVGPGATVRLTGDQIASSRPASRSPMPEGLLDGIADDDLAALYAYLQTLVPETLAP